jgi:hypothetical protein
MPVQRVQCANVVRFHCSSVSPSPGLQRYWRSTGFDLSNMNVLVGGENSGIPTDNGVDTGKGLLLPRVGIAYRPMEKTVIRLGYGMTADSNNWRFLRNGFPAVTVSDFTGFGGNASAPAASLTGLNAVGPYAGLPVGIPAMPLTGGTTPGVFPRA